MDERITRESVEEHLVRVLASEVFTRAELQGRVLRILARAALRRRTLKGIELARKIYGRSGRAYIKATQQVVREIRLKLPLYYTSAPGSEIVFEIAPDRHELVIRRRNDEPGPSSRTGGASPDDGLPKIHT
jgi:hypothetical protein